MHKTVKPLLIVLSVLFLWTGSTHAQVAGDAGLEDLLQAAQSTGDVDLIFDKLYYLWNQRSLDLVQDLVGAERTDDAKRRQAAHQALEGLRRILVQNDAITDGLSNLLTYDKANPRFAGDDDFINRLRGYVASVLSDKKSKALPFLFNILQEKHYGGRDWAASTAIANIGGLSDEQLGVLNQILNDASEPERGVKFWAAYGLTERGFRSDAITAAALDELQIGNPYHKAMAAYVLEKTGNYNQPYSTELWESLNRERELYRRILAGFQEQQRSISIKRSLNELSYDEEKKDFETQNSLWYLAQVVAQLARTLASQHVHPTELTTTLVDLMTSTPLWLPDRASTVGFGPDAGERFSVVTAFEWLGFDAAKVLLPMYESNPKGFRRRDVIVALGYVREPAVAALPLLFRDLRDKELLLFRHEIIVAIGRIGSAVPDTAIPKLIDVHRSREFDQDIAAGEALEDLALQLRDTERGVNFIALLEKAKDELQNNDREAVRKNAANLESVIQILNQRWWQQFFRGPFFTYGKYFLPFALLLAVWFILFLARPYYLFKINEQLSKLPLEMRFFGSVGGPLRYLLLVGFFHYRRRVLDAWVAKQVENARLRFSNRTTVKERTNYVAIPVEFDDEKLTSLKPESLKPLFERTAVALMVSGEGGIGKTSLACLIANWSMAQDDELRLCKHYILPAMIEQDFEILVGNTTTNIVEQAIQLQLKGYAQQEEVPSVDLVRHLLKQKRIMIIIDGFSEFDETVRGRIMADISRLPVNALILTSRHAEYLEEYAPASIQPMKIGGQFLSDFLGTYLTERKIRNCFDDEEFFDLCRRISLLSNGRLVTALLVKLFADLAVGIKLKDLDEDLPQNLPDVFLYYINYLNREFDEAATTNQRVQALMKIVAWHCLRNSFHPAQANTVEVLNAFGETDEAASLLDHLEQRLNLIRRVGVSRDRVRFVLEPLSEYLASMYWLELNGNDDEQWHALFSKLATSKQADVPISGFIHGLQDCCATKYAGLIPDFAPLELEKISGVGMEDLLKNNAQKRVKHILHDLNVLDTESLKIIRTKLFTQGLAVGGMAG
jgi:hypothetical protein